jgi:hypothetical protein
MDVPQLLLILKQYGPLVAISLFLLFWFSRRIDSLLDRNALIYEKHIEHLWETQKQLMAAVLGAQDSSEAAPTVDDMKKKALTRASEAPSNLPEGGAKQ